MEMNTLNDVLTEQLGDLYSAEQQLVEALPKMAGAASSQELRTAFEQHLEETRGHVKRLEQAFSEIGIKPPAEECEAMKGLIKEGDKVVKADGQPAAKDAALIAAAQRVEHYEIAGYGTVRTLARELDMDEVSSLMSETLDEESAADEKLTTIATGGALSSGVNSEAR
jgi:ferritin-like metal-binding protein YciE